MGWSVFYILHISWYIALLYFIKAFDMQEQYREVIEQDKQDFKGFAF